MITDDTMLFSGDWEWAPEAEAYVMAFEAVRFEEPWNGHAVPVVSWRVANALVLRWQLLSTIGQGVHPQSASGIDWEEYDNWQWDGDAIAITSEDYEESRVIPIEGEAGLLEYVLDIGYTFSQLGDDARVLAVVRCGVTS